jgi:hypothetical protein
MRTTTTTSSLSEDNGVSDRLIAHYSLIAAGGTGTIVTEALRIHPSVLHGPFGIAAFKEDRPPGPARWADAIHGEGALLIGQLNHSGRQHTSTSIPHRLVGPSPVACPRSGGVPHPLTIMEIAELADRHVMSAANIARAGFDGVEVAALVARVAEAGPLSLKAAKRAGRAALGTGTGTGTGYELERELWEQLSHTDDRAEGRAAFREKRDSRFTGTTTSPSPPQHTCSSQPSDSSAQKHVGQPESLRNPPRASTPRRRQNRILSPHCHQRAGPT